MWKLREWVVSRGRGQTVVSVAQCLGGKKLGEAVFISSSQAESGEKCRKSFRKVNGNCL